MVQACSEPHGGAAGRVVAIEPNPRNVALLAQSAKDNGFDNIEGDSGRPVRAPGRRGLGDRREQRAIIPVDGPPATPVEAEFVVASYPWTMCSPRPTSGEPMS